MKNGPSEEAPKVDTKQNAEVLAKLEKIETNHFTITGKKLQTVSHKLTTKLKIMSKSSIDS